MDFFEEFDRRRDVAYQTKEVLKKTDAKAADNDIHYCTKCKRCWEINYIAFKNRKDRDKEQSSYLNYYSDFPTYGKKRKVCKWGKDE